MMAAGLRRRLGARTIRGPLTLLGAALLCWILAYQSPLRLTLHVGGEVETRRRFDEEPFLRGINGSEPPDRLPDPANPGAQLWWWEYVERTGDRPYRWTTAETILHIPGAGGSAYVVEILAGGRSGGAPAVWEAGPELRYALTLPEGLPRRYRILAAPEPGGDLRIRLSTTPFKAPGDPRELGFVLYTLRLQPADAAPRSPAWPQLAWLGLALGGWVLWALLAAGSGTAIAVAVLGIAAAAYLLSYHRMALTLFTPTVAALAVLGATITASGALVTRRLVRQQARPSDLQSDLFFTLTPMIALAAAAFAVRVAGMLHPHARYSDAGLQANKLYEVMLGRVFLTAGLPSDAGGGQAPYLPGPFLTLMPLALTMPPGPEARVLLMQLGTALLDSVTVAAIWLILLRNGMGRRAALFGAACYLLPVTALESFSVGELANLGGQALAIPFLTLLAIGTVGHQAVRKQPAERNRQGAGQLPLVIALTVALLGHSGVTLSVGAMVAAAWGQALIALGHARLTGRQHRPEPAVPGYQLQSFVTLSIVAGAALAIAVLIYYSAPVYLGTLAGRGGGGMPPLAILAETVRGVLGVAPPGRRALAIPTLLSLTALGGLTLLWAGKGITRAAGALRTALAAWWISLLLTQGLLLVADQGVRWGLFLYPALCLSAGPLLAAYWRRGQAGRLVAALSIAFIIVYGLAHWVVQVRDYYHL